MALRWTPSSSALGLRPAEEPPLAAQQGVIFSLSFNSAEYDPDTGEVKYPNGAHEIVAGVTVKGSEEAYSNRMEVEFKNGSFVAASVSGLGDGARNSKTGQVWYGGPDVSVEISALAVSYSSGAAVSSVTLLQFCGDDAATDSEAPFSFPVDCDGFQSDEKDGTTPMFNVGGADIDSKGGKVYLDFKAPDAPHFQPNPNKREGGWVNADVGFTAEYKDEKGKKDGWLNYNDDNADDGVGEYTPQIRFAESGDDNEVGGAVDALALTQDVVLPALAALAGQSSKTDEYCVVVSAVDMLGNQSKLPKADEDCVTAEVYAAADDDKPAGLLVGWDLQEPTITFTAASPKANGTSLREFQVQVADEGSKIRDKDPISVTAEIRNEENDEKAKKLKADDVGLNISLPLATTESITNAGEGYYTFSAKTVDKAGNSSVEIVRTALHDTEDPKASTIPPDNYDEKTSTYSLIATLTDNLSIKEYWAEARFDGLQLGGDIMLRTEDENLDDNNYLFLPREGGVPVDAYNAEDLTQAHLASDLTAQTYRAIQTGAEAITNLSSLAIFARDNAGRVSAGGLEAGGDANVTPGIEITDGFTITPGVLNAGTELDPSVVTAKDRKVFEMFVAEAEVDDGVVELTATASGPLFLAPIDAAEPVPDNTETPDVNEAVAAVTPVPGSQGLRDNPISRVDFYALVATDKDGGNGRDALKFIGSTPGGAAGWWARHGR